MLAVSGWLRLRCWRNNASDHLPAGADAIDYSIAAYSQGTGQVYCVVRRLKCQPASMII